MYVILLGPPGAGKGTQAQQVAERLGVPHVATGDLFRGAIQERTELGQLAEPYLKGGELVPDEITLGLVRERLQQPDASSGALLDGFPRTVEQADGLDALLAELGGRIDKVIYLEVSTSELVRRLGGRWICRSCQAVYHSSFSPPAESGVCDQCGGELFQRPDDVPEVVQRRLEVYSRQTAPLVDRYERAGLLVRVNGQQPAEGVTVEILGVLD